LIDSPKCNGYEQEVSSLATAARPETKGEPAGQIELAPWLTPARFMGLIALLLLAAFPKVLLGLESFYYRDYGVLGYPFVFHHHASFWRGEFPLWNPLSNCGAPFLAQWGTMTLYPFSIFYLIFPLPWSLTYFCFGHVLLGSLGMYFLAYRWTQNRLGAALAGTAFVFNGVMFSCLLWPNYLVALGWMPWVVLTAERSWNEGGRRIVIAALVAALQLLAGVPEIVVLTWTLTGALWLHRLFSESAGRLIVTRRLFVVIALAAGLTAIQLLPFCDLLLHSHRDRTFSVSKWAMPASGWGNFLVPLFHCFETPQGPFFEYGQEFFTSHYLGVGMMALMAWALWKVRTARVWILSALALLAVLLAFGENGFLFPLVKRFVPFVGIARYPIKFVILPAFALPLIGAFAISRFQSSGPLARGAQRAFILVSTVIAGLIILTLVLAKLHPLPYDQWAVTLKNGVVRAGFLVVFAGCLLFLFRATGEKSRLVLSLGLLLVVFTDARTHTAQQNPSLPTQLLAPGLWEARAKEPGPKHGVSRVFITPQTEQHMLFNLVRNPTDQFLGERLALWSNLNLLDQIPKVNGSSTLQVREQMLLQKRLYEQTNGLPFGLLDFLCVSHVSSAESIVDWTSRTNYCRFITAGQKPEFADDTTALVRLMDSRFDPRKTVILPVDLKGLLAVTNSAAVELSKGEVSTHRIRFHTSASKAALCVIPQSFYHCWSASVDGAPTRLLRANVAFQAVVVPAGTHEIAVVYRDQIFRLGLVVCVLTAIACVIVWRSEGGRKKEKAA